jgi:hypothetical protein
MSATIPNNSDRYPPKQNPTTIAQGKIIRALAKATITIAPVVEVITTASHPGRVRV